MGRDYTALSLWRCFCCLRESLFFNYGTSDQFMSGSDEPNMFNLCVANLANNPLYWLRWAP